MGYPPALVGMLDALDTAWDSFGSPSSVSCISPTFVHCNLKLSYVHKGTGDKQARDYKNLGKAGQRDCQKKNLKQRQGHPIRTPHQQVWYGEAKGYRNRLLLCSQAEMRRLLPPTPDSQGNQCTSA